MVSVSLPDDLQHRYAQINGIRMHYVEAGSGPTVVLLHGFPENWYSWRHQIAALAPRYRVVAPDLRGYNETENAGPYDTDTLQQDVLALLDHLGEDQVHLVAHDWGAAIAWLIGMNHGERLRTLTICNVPHPALFQAGLRRPRQLLRSSYIFFFQIPWLPEKLLAAQGYHGLARGIIRDCQPGTFSRDDVKAFLESWRRQGLGGGINWYRALVRHRRPLADRVPLVGVPTLLIWGENDRALGKDLTYGTETYVRDLEIQYLPNASHWVQQDAPARVNEVLLRHLDKPGGPPP